MKKKILIVGGTGFIGYALSKKCITLRYNVFSLSSKKVKSFRKLDKVTYLCCDISQKKKTNQNFKK